MDYDRTELPTNYDHARAVPDATMRLWLERVTAHVPPTEVEEIIDLGCGTGRFSAALADAFAARVIGIDPSEKMLAEARSKAFANVVFRRSPARLRGRRQPDASGDGERGTAGVPQAM
jgi:ubiquinone/menaquinone biosynthesis C-methylase UbiE